MKNNSRLTIIYLTQINILPKRVSTKYGDNMSKVLFGAFYEAGNLNIEAFDNDLFVDLQMRFHFQKPVDVNNPTVAEKTQFRTSVTTALRSIAANFNEAKLGYQGPSRSHNNFRRGGNRPIVTMSLWAEFIYDELQVICPSLMIDFRTKVKTSKPKSNVSVINSNFLTTIKWFTDNYVSRSITAKQRHCFAAALDLGNALPSYRTWVRRLETHQHRATGQAITRQVRQLINQVVSQIPT